MGLRPDHRRDQPDRRASGRHGRRGFAFGRAARRSAAAIARGPHVVFAGASTDSNLAMSLGIPAVTIGGGGEGGNWHSLNEWYKPTDAYLGPQNALLTLLMLWEWRASARRSCRVARRGSGHPFNAREACAAARTGKPRGLLLAACASKRRQRHRQSVAWIRDRQQAPVRPIAGFNGDAEIVEQVPGKTFGLHVSKM